MQVIKQDLGYDLHRTDGHCHHQLPSDQVGNDDGVNRTHYPPGDGLEQAFGIAVFPGLGGEKLFGELV